ncbi:MAG: Gfo/Idh/MocA family oxidoreductase [Gemmatimonadetes bacterium]|nr:Gfo/Idh/MocA family oxidoreductase [Gemmatimonadota bacterium]
MDALRMAVIGVGRLGEAHARVLAGMPGVRLCGVYDVREERADEVAHRYGTTALDSLSRVAEEAEAATVVVPTTAHCEVASFTLAQGLHTFVEKPIAATVAEADRLIDLSESRGLVLQVGHIERFNGAFRALEGMDIAPGFIEAHRLASFDPRGTDVSVVHDLMIHDIDLILRLVRSDLESVDATGVAVISDQVDIANARMRFADGCVANVTASRISLKKMRKLRIFQRDHYVSMDFLAGESEIYRLIDDPGRAGARGLKIPVNTGDGRVRHITRQKTAKDRNEPLVSELSSFVSAVRGDAPAPVTGYDGREALRVSLAVIEQIEADNR